MATPASETAGAIDPEIVTTLHLLALRYYRHQMYDESACLLEFVLRHAPANAELHAARGKALHALGRHEAALLAYGRALRLGLADAELHFCMGQCLIFLRRYPPAAEALQRSLGLAALQPLRHEALVERAKLLQARVRALLDKPARAPAPAPAQPALRQAAGSTLGSTS